MSGNRPNRDGGSLMRRGLPATVGSSPSPEQAVSPSSPENHPAFVYLARLSPGSRRTMRQALDAIASIVSGGTHDAEALPWQHLRYTHTQAVRAVLAQRYAPATANKMLAALRGALREAWRLGLMDADAYRRAADLETVRGSRLPSGRALTPGELRALFRACADDHSAAGRRDAALLAVLYGGGLRRSEVVGLDTGDYDADAGALAVRAGKGRKERTVYVARGAREAVAAWLRVRGPATGPLFLPIDKAGQLRWRRLTDQAVLVIVRKRASAAGVGQFSPHDLRRTFISDLLDQGADIVSVGHLAGHADVSTTARYDRRGEAAKRKAAELLHVPYVG